MAHFAEIDANNTVIRVLVTDNNDPNGDEGRQWLVANLGGTWIKTSYTSRGGNRIDPVTGEIVAVGEHFRFNYAGAGDTYDASRDAFIPPQPFPSWILDEDRCQWTPPVVIPEDGNAYSWDEDSTAWVPATPTS